MREHLTHFDIAGFTYYEGVLAFNSLEIGTELQFKLEENNKFDARAVAIYYNEFKLGFVPKSENRIIYKLLKVEIDCLEIRVQRINKNETPEKQIGVIIHLVNSKNKTQED